MDTHRWGDAPRAESKILQGVTTEVIGHCGFSLAPVLRGRAPSCGEYLAGFAPWIETCETSFATYMESFSPKAVNTIMQVGHNTLRLMTIGRGQSAGARSGGGCPGVFRLAQSRSRRGGHESCHPFAEPSRGLGGRHLPTCRAGEPPMTGCGSRDQRPRLATTSWRGGATGG